MKITPIQTGDETLKVMPVDDNDTYDDIGIPEELPQHPFLCYAPGPTSAGKSTIIQWLLATHYNNFFNKIYIISSTIDKDISYRHFNFADNRKFDRYTEENMKLIVNDIEQSHNQKCLIIVDDMSARNIWGLNTEFVKFVSVHRHSPSRCPPNICGTSIFIISHAYKTIPRKIRGLMSDLIIFRILSVEEVRAISDDNRGNMKHDEFLEMYEYCVAEQYNFLYIKKRVKDPNMRFRKNFDTILQIEN